MRIAAGYEYVEAKSNQKSSEGFVMTANISIAAPFRLPISGGVG
jgi:hypothetical protein